MWSGGELDNNISSSECSPYHISKTISTDFSSNGNASIKLVAHASDAYIRFFKSINQEDIGKTATIKTKVYIPEGSCSAIIMLDNSVKSTVIIPESADRVVDLLLTTNILEDSSNVLLQFSLNNSSLIYVDALECYFE